VTLSSHEEKDLLRRRIFLIELECVYKRASHLDRGVSFYEEDIAVPTLP